MPKYSVMFASQTTSTSIKSVIACYMVTDSTRQAEIVECIWTGSGSVAAADIQHRGSLAGDSFASNTGVSTTITPVPWNPAASAAIGNYGVNHSTNPGGANAVQAVTVGFNQRGGMRWAVPQGEGYKITNAGTTDKGATMGTISSAAGNVDANLHFWQGN
jgi:hypothetical protein